MKTQNTKLARLATILCAVPALGLLICQLLPFWELEGEKISISKFIWFCFEHTNFETFFKNYLGDRNFSAGSIAGMNALTLLGCALGIFFCIKNSDRPRPLLFPAVGAATALYSYIAYPIYRIGANWQIHLVFCIATLVMVVLSLIFWLTGKKKA